MQGVERDKERANQLGELVRMNHRRSREEVLLDVLKAVSMGYEKPTRIMYASNVSWTVVLRRLIELVDKELIVVVVNSRTGVRTPRVYKITTKGEQLLRDSRSVFEHLNASFMR